MKKYVLTLVLVAVVCGRASAQIVSGSANANANSVLNPALGSYTGSVGITGNQGNGTDAIKNLCVNGVCPVTAWAASGSANSYTCSITASTTALSCTAPTDFALNQYVLIPGAGPNALQSTPANPTVTQHGTTGSSTFGYKIALIDDWGGITAVNAAEQTVTNQSAPLSPVVYNQIAVGAGTGVYWATVLYRTTAPSPYATGPIGIFRGGSGNMYDGGAPIIPATALAIPRTPPASAVPQVLVAQITGVTDNQHFTIGTAATNTATSVTTIHDETQAFQNCANAASSINGVCQIPPGTFNLDQTSYWVSPSWVYTNPTTAVGLPANEEFGRVHLGSNVVMAGFSKDQTLIKGPWVTQPGVYGALFTTANPTATRVSGAVCNTGAEGDMTQDAISNATRGQKFVQLSTATNYTHYTVGGIVITGGGANSANVSCGNASLPRIEANVVTAIDPNGLIQLRYGISTDLPYGTPGTAAFIAAADTWFHHDVTLRDMTLDSTSGGAAFAMASVVRAKLDRLALTSESFRNKMNMGGSRDVLLSDDYIFSTSQNEMDQTQDIVYDRDVIDASSSNNLLIFDEGDAGGRIINSKLSFTDGPYFGIDGAVLSPVPLVPACISDFLVDNNTFNVGTTVTLAQIINEATACNGGEPNPSDWTITHNHFNVSTTGANRALGMTFTATPINNLVVKDNTFNVYAGATNSYAIKTNTGNISGNIINSLNGNLNGTAGGGIISAVGSTSTIPLTIEGNQCTSPGTSVDFCVSTNNTASAPVMIFGNTAYAGAANYTTFWNQGSTYPTAIYGNSCIGCTQIYKAGSYDTQQKPWSGAAPTIAVSTTNFITENELPVAAAISTEANAQSMAGGVCTISNLSVTIATASNANAPVITVNKNAVGSTVTCSITSGTTCTDSAHSFTTVATDLLDVGVANPASANSTGVVKVTFRKTCV